MATMFWQFSMLAHVSGVRLQLPKVPFIAMLQIPLPRPAQSAQSEGGFLNPVTAATTALSTLAPGTSEGR